jgi:hypothetical protein
VTDWAIFRKRIGKHSQVLRIGVHCYATVVVTMALLKADIHGNELLKAQQWRGTIRFNFLGTVSYIRSAEGL